MVAFPESRVEELACERAILLLQQRRHDLAEEELRRALGANPRDANALQLLAVCKMSQGDCKAAHAAAREAIEAAPTWAFAHCRHAWTILVDPSYVPIGASSWQLLNRSDRNDPRIREVMRLLKEALALDPNLPYAWQLLSIAWTEVKRFDKALGAVEKALQLTPHDADLHGLRARVLWNLRRDDDATAANREALAINPQDAGILRDRGVMLMTAHPREAKDVLSEAVRIDPTNSAAREGLFDALQVDRPLLRWAQRLHGPLGQRGWLRLGPVACAAFALLIAGLIVVEMIGFPPHRAIAARTIVMAIAVGLPLSLVWLRNFGRYVLSFDARARFLITPRQRAIAHFLVYLIPSLLLLPLAGVSRFPAPLAWALITCTAPIGAATAMPRGRIRTALLAYAGLYAIVACAVAQVYPVLPGWKDPVTFYGGGAAAAAPFVLLAWWGKRGMVH